MRKWIVALVLALALLGVPDSHATDPDGFLALRSEWVETEDPGSYGLSPDEQLLRVQIQAIREIRGVELSWTVPEGARLQRVVWTEGALDRESAGARRHTLGDLSAGQIRLLSFAVLVPAEGGGIAAFTANGSLAGETVIRESAGVPVGEVEPGGRRRAGAIEYLAGSGEGEGR